MGDLPESIPFSRVIEALASLGISVDDTLSVDFGVDGVTVERARVIADGRTLPFGRNVATVTTTIGYTREDDAR